MARKYRYRRFVRNPMPLSYRLQSQDLELLTQLAEHRFLDTYQLLALQPRGLRNLRRRLQYLFHDGLVDRPPRQHNMLEAPKPMVYALGKQGAELLATLEGLEREKIDWQIHDWHDANRDAGLTYIEHSLMIANFRVALTVALRSLEHASLTTWLQGERLKAKIKEKGKRLPINPDGFFTIEHKGRRLHFFLEADRSTETRAVYQGKLARYWQWWKASGYQRKDGLNIPRFRLLTLTLTEKRKETLRDLARYADQRQQGSAMFLFASERNRNGAKTFPLEEPGGILTPIWQCGEWKAGTACSRWHSLLE